MLTLILSAIENIHSAITGITPPFPLGWCHRIHNTRAHNSAQVI
jgi:hypothetical protein